MTQPEFYARSASDKDPNWPIWFVASRSQGGLNVTAEVAERFLGWDTKGATLTDRESAEFLANVANTGDDK